MGVTHELRAGHDGDFHVRLEAPPQRPFTPGLHPVSVLVPGARARSWIRVVSDAAPFVLISDIDDTIAVTQVVETRKLIGNALFKDATTQAPVPGMSAWYRCMLAEKLAQPGLGFVSGSPVQFLPRVQQFLRLHAFPPAALYLRNLSLSTLKGYKEPVLDQLLQTLPNPLVLVGDSGERDPEIYAALRQRAPDRVRRIYIRRAGRAEDPQRFEGMFLFDHAREAAADAVERGFMSPECFAREFPSPVTP